MKRTRILTRMMVLLSSVVVSISAWAKDETSYYYQTQLIAEANDSAMGKVYVGTGNTAPSESQYAAKVESSVQRTKTANPPAKPAFYVWARQNDGYEFKGWSKDKSATSGSGEMATTWTVTNDQGDEDETYANSPVVTETVYAIFAPVPRQLITFAANEGGAYTVNGGEPATNPTNVFRKVELALTATPDDRHGVIGWYVDDGKAKTYLGYGKDATYAVVDKDVTIGVEFYPLAGVVSVKTYQELVEALETAQAVEIPKGTTIDAQGQAVVVGNGQKLFVNGELLNADTGVGDNYVIASGGKLYRKNAVAVCGNQSFTSFGQATAVWTSGELKLLADVTITQTLGITGDQTLNLSTHTLTASGCRAIELRGTGGCNLKVTADATSPGGIKASSGVFYAVYTAPYQVKKQITVNGGVFDGPCTFNSGSGGGKSTPLVVTLNGGTFNGTISEYRCYYFTLQGGTYNKKITMQSDSTCKAHIYAGRFKTRDLIYNQSGTGKAIAGDGADWDGISQADYFYVDRDGYWVLTRKSLPADYEAIAGGWRYMSAEMAFKDYSDGNITLRAKVATAKTVADNKVLSIDATDNGEYAGDVTLGGKNAKFVIKVAAGREYKGAVKPYSTYQLRVVREDDETTGAVTFTYSNITTPVTAENAEAQVGDVYYETLFQAFYDLDGTQGKTVKLLKDVTNCPLITNGRAASADGKTDLTLDLNGHKFGLSEIGTSNDAAYTLTFVDSVGGGEVVNTESSLTRIGMVAYLSGVVDLTGSYALVAKGGIWHFNPDCYEMGGSKFDFVPEGYMAVDNGDGTWTVREQSVDVMVAQVPGMTVIVKVGDMVIAGVNGVYAVDPGARVTATYTVNDGYCGETVVKEIAAAAEGDEIALDESEKAKAVVATIGETGFGSVAAAVAAADGRTVVLVADVAEAVAVRNARAAVDFAGRTLTGSVALDASELALGNSGEGGGFVGADAVGAAISAANGSSLSIAGGSYQADGQMFACDATSAIGIADGRFSTDEFGAYLDSQHQPAELEDGWWTVGVKVVTEEKEQEENTAAVIEKASDSDVRQEALAEVVPEEMKVVVNDQEVVVSEKIVQETKVEGVKLTATEKTVATADGQKSGIQAVVDAAKARAAESADDTSLTLKEQEDAQAFAEAIKETKNIEVKVVVTVTPKVYEAAADAEVKGQATFDLRPEAKVTVKTKKDEVETTHEQVVPVTNDMIDREQKIAVTLFTGFCPKTIIHSDDDGNIINVFKEGEIDYDAAKGTAVVMIDHFSQVTAFGEDYVAQIAEDPSRKFTTVDAAIAALGAGQHVELLADAATLGLPEGWRVYSYQGKTLLVKVPMPVVTKLTDEEVAELNKDKFIVVEFTDDLDNPAYVCDFPTAFCYKFDAQGGETEFDNWYVDYTVSFDRDIARNSMGLMGNYVIPNESAFFLKGDVYLGFFAKDAVPAGRKVPLLNYMTKYNNWTYKQIREIVSSFKCGAFNLSEDNVGAKMTVELRLFAPTMTPEDIRDSSKWVEGVNTFVVHSEVEEFAADGVLPIPAQASALITDKAWPELYYAGTATAEMPIPAGAYYLEDATFKLAEEPVEVELPTAFFAESYVVTFVSEHGEAPADMRYFVSATETPLPKPANVTEDDITFNGWAFPEGTVVANAIPAGMTGNLALTAMWTDATKIVVKETEESSTPTVEIKVTKDWIAENVKKDPDVDPTPQEIQEELNKKDDNGNLKWQNYVIGIVDPTAQVEGDAQQNAEEKTVKVVPENVVAPLADTGFTVSYSLDEVKTDGEVVAAGAATTSDNLNVDLDSVESNAFFKVNVIITRDDGTGEPTKIAATNTLGVLKVSEAPATSIVAVPWKDIGGEDVTVDKLVKTATLTPGDKLYVYEADGKSYTTWKLDALGEWQTTGEGGEKAGETSVPRGSAVWLKRQDSTKPIVLFGQAETEKVETTIEPAVTETEKNWNIVAAPTVEPVDLNEKFNEKTKDDVAKDQIIVPTDGAPKNYTFENGTWGYTEAVTVEDPKTGKKRVKATRVTTDTKVPAGTGFWYLNGGNGTKVNW